MNRIFHIVFLFFCFGTGSVFAQNDTYGLQNTGDMKGVEVVIFGHADTRKPARVNGDYPFTINGLNTSLHFKNGVAQLPVNINNSTFLYIKQRKDGHSNAKLFFVYRFSELSDFNIVNVPLVYLLVVPLVLILIGMFFRRLIILILIVLVVLFYFSHSKGLDLSSFFDGIKEWLLSWL